jgi:hypothetical protein
MRIHEGSSQLYHHAQHHLAKVHSHRPSSFGKINHTEPLLKHEAPCVYTKTINSRLS